MRCNRVAAVVVALQGGHAVRHGSHRDLQVSDNSGSCNTLLNEGSFATVELSVGSPPQKLQVVADTGSDRVLVESCACKKGGGCSNDTRCFTGDKTSKTFTSPEDPRKVTITFGSGPIETVIATDQVSLGNISAEMTDSLMMISKNKLRNDIQLEGILGLGMPHNEQSFLHELGFLDRARVERFSMCFNKGQDDGMLRLGTKSYVAMDKSLPGVGVKHWSVELPGMSIGNQSLNIASDLLTQESAIVDSGTTLILGPQDAIIELLGRICDAWPKCQGSSSLLQAGATRGHAVSKAKALFHEAAACDLDGMPSVYFHVRGKDGARDVLEMTPDDYMMRIGMQLRITKKLFGAQPDAGPSEQRPPCQPAFDLRKSSRGAKFILGSPFFYKYNIAYDRASQPPAISFNRAECGSCGGMASSFIASRSSSRRVLTTEPREGVFEEE